MDAKKERISSGSWRETWRQWTNLWLPSLISTNFYPRQSIANSIITLIRSSLWSDIWVCVCGGVPYGIFTFSLIQGYWMLRDCIWLQHRHLPWRWNSVLKWATKQSTPGIQASHLSMWFMWSGGCTFLFFFFESVRGGRGMFSILLKYFYCKIWL